jgi:hypothetical protein
MTAFKRALTIAALALLSLFSEHSIAPAQAQPCQWNYSAPGNVSTATYCGDVNVTGIITSQPPVGTSIVKYCPHGAVDYGVCINAAIADTTNVEPIVYPSNLIGTFSTPIVNPLGRCVQIEGALVWTGSGAAPITVGGSDVVTPPNSCHQIYSLSRIKSSQSSWPDAYPAVLLENLAGSSIGRPRITVTASNFQIGVETEGNNHGFEYILLDGAINNAECGVLQDNEGTGWNNANDFNFRVNNDTGLSDTNPLAPYCWLNNSSNRYEGNNYTGTFELSNSGIGGETVLEIQNGSLSNNPGIGNAFDNMYVEYTAGGSGGAYLINGATGTYGNRFTLNYTNLATPFFASTSGAGQTLDILNSVQITENNLQVNSSELTPLFGSNRSHMVGT